MTFRLTTSSSNWFPLRHLCSTFCDRERMADGQALSRKIIWNIPELRHLHGQMDLPVKMAIKSMLRVGAAIDRQAKNLAAFPPVIRCFALILITRCLVTLLCCKSSSPSRAFFAAFIFGFDMCIHASLLPRRSYWFGFEFHVKLVFVRAGERVSPRNWKKAFQSARWND